MRDRFSRGYQETKKSPTSPRHLSPAEKYLKKIRPDCVYEDGIWRGVSEKTSSSHLVQIVRDDTHRALQVPSVSPVEALNTDDFDDLPEIEPSNSLPFSENNAPWPYLLHKPLAPEKLQIGCPALERNAHTTKNTSRVQVISTQPNTYHRKNIQEKQSILHNKNYSHITREHIKAACLIIDSKLGIPDRDEIVGLSDLLECHPHIIKEITTELHKHEIPVDENGAREILLIDYYQYKQRAA